MDLEREKLLELMEAIASLLDQGNDDAWLEPETFARLAGMKAFLEEWLQGGCPLTDESHVAALARLTDGLKPEIVLKHISRTTLH